MRRAARVDGNHGEIRAALRAAGRPVFDCSKIGGGFPDLLTQHLDGRLLLLEVKDGSKPPSARKLREGQKEFAIKFPVHVVTSVDGALRAVGFTVMPR